MQQPLPKDQAIIPVDGQHWCNVFKTFLRRLVSVKRHRVSTRINLQNAARRMWTCVKPEHRLYRVKFWIVVINFHPLSTNFQTMEPFQICLNCNLSTFQFLVFGKDTWKLVVSPVKFFYFLFLFIFCPALFFVQTFFYQLTTCLALSFCGSRYIVKSATCQIWQYSWWCHMFLSGGTCKWDM